MPKGSKLKELLLTLTPEGLASKVPPEMVGDMVNSVSAEGIKTAIDAGMPMGASIKALIRDLPMKDLPQKDKLQKMLEYAQSLSPTRGELATKTKAFSPEQWSNVKEIRGLGEGAEGFYNDVDNMIRFKWDPGKPTSSFMALTHEMRHAYDRAKLMAKGIVTPDEISDMYRMGVIEKGYRNEPSEQKAFRAQVAAIDRMWKDAIKKGKKPF